MSLVLSVVLITRSELLHVCAGIAMRHLKNPQVAFAMEVSGYLVGSAAFKAVGTSEPRPAGSIPVRLRQQLLRAQKFNR